MEDLDYSVISFLRPIVSVNERIYGLFLFTLNFNFNFCVIPNIIVEFLLYESIFRMFHTYSVYTLFGYVKTTLLSFLIHLSINYKYLSFRVLPVLPSRKVVVNI